MGKKKRRIGRRDNEGGREEREQEKVKRGGDEGKYMKKKGEKENSQKIMRYLKEIV